ncbi:MAG: penicillin-binding protein 1C [Myxococcaceae bacterium]
MVASVGAALFFHSLDGTLHHRQPSHLLLDRTGRFLGEVPGSNEAWGFWPVPDTLPDKVVITTLETEDRNFNDHPGVHLPSVLRAAWQNLRNRKVISGASTIPMQLSRLQHPKPRTLWSKIREAAEALWLVHENGRDAVLRQYLTIAPYGNRCHGVVRAARLYFDKPIEDLSWLQAAYLAALPQQPGRMGPWTEKGHAAALTRARRILKQLHQRGVIDDEDLRIALNSDLHVVPRPSRRPDSMHFLLAAAREVRGSPDIIHRTTLDLDVQRFAAKALNDNLSRVRGLGATNTAGLVIDLTSGDVLAQVGSADYFDQDAHGAIDFTNTRRSPGSALKPFIYGLALERGSHTAATVLADTAVEFDLPGGNTWAPENITHTFLGPMLLREALGNSRNIPALRVLSEVGVEEMLQRFERGGVSGVRYTPEAYGLALAIGALPVTPSELATLYTALAHQGVTLPLRTMLDAPKVDGQRVLSSDAAALIAHILADPGARRPGFPVGSALDFDHAVSVKTGTSQGYRDAWAVAFDDRVLVVSWLGNHDWRRMNLASGATAAAPAAHRILDEVSERRLAWLPPMMERPLPASLVKKEVCALSGGLPGPGCTHLKTEFFIPGTEPHDACPFHVEVAIDVRNGLRAGPGCPEALVRRQPMLALPDTYDSWARKQRLQTAPTSFSPLCPAADDTGAPAIAIREPRSKSRYLYDPDTPPELSTVRFSARVSPASEEVVWLVDDTPVARVGFPHELRWHLSPGKHVIRARLAQSGQSSASVTVEVDD